VIEDWVPFSAWIAGSWWRAARTCAAAGSLPPRQATNGSRTAQRWRRRPAHPASRKLSYQSKASGGRNAGRVQEAACWRIRRSSDPCLAPAGQPALCPLTDLEADLLARLAAGEQRRRQLAKRAGLYLDHRSSGCAVRQLVSPRCRSPGGGGRLVQWLRAKQAEAPNSALIEARALRQLCAAMGCHRQRDRIESGPGRWRGDGVTRQGALPRPSPGRCSAATPGSGAAPTA